MKTKPDTFVYRKRKWCFCHVTLTRRRIKKMRTKIDENLCSRRIVIFVLNDSSKIVKSNGPKYSETIGKKRTDSRRHFIWMCCELVVQIVHQNHLKLGFCWQYTLSKCKHNNKEIGIQSDRQWVKAKARTRQTDSELTHFQMWIWSLCSWYDKKMCFATLEI